MVFVWNTLFQSVDLKDLENGIIPTDTTPVQDGKAYNMFVMYGLRYRRTIRYSTCQKTSLSCSICNKGIAFISGSSSSDTYYRHPYVFWKYHTKVEA